MSKNYVIDTTQFYIKLAYNISYNNLPLDISSIITADVKRLFKIKFNNIQPLNGALTKIIVVNIQNCLIAGLISIFIITAISIYSIFGRFLCLINILLRFRILRTGIHLIFNLIYYIPFFVTAVILYILKLKL